MEKSSLRKKNNNNKHPVVPKLSFCSSYINMRRRCLSNNSHNVTHQSPIEISNTARSPVNSFLVVILFIRDPRNHSNLGGLDLQSPKMAQVEGIGGSSKLLPNLLDRLEYCRAPSTQVDVISHETNLVLKGLQV